MQFISELRSQNYERHSSKADDEETSGLRGFLRKEVLFLMPDSFSMDPTFPVAADVCTLKTNIMDDLVLEIGNKKSLA